MIDPDKTDPEAPAPTPPEAAPDAGQEAPTAPRSATPGRKPSGAANRRRKAQEAAAAGRQPASAKAVKGALSADARAIKAASEDLITMAGLMLAMQGPTGQADAQVLATFAGPWSEAFAAVVDKHPQLKRALAGGAGIMPEATLALVTFQAIMAIKANHPSKPRQPRPAAPRSPAPPAGGMASPVAGNAGVGDTAPAPATSPAPGLVGVPDPEQLDPEVLAMLANGFTAQR